MPTVARSPVTHYIDPPPLVGLRSRAFVYYTKKKVAGNGVLAARVHGRWWYT